MRTITVNICLATALLFGYTVAGAQPLMPEAMPEKLSDQKLLASYARQEQGASADSKRGKVSGSQEFAEIQPDVADRLVGFWVKVRSWYHSGEELPDGSLLKTGYLRYEFRPGRQLFKSSAAADNGFPFAYNVENGILIASVMKYHIQHLSADSLVLVELGKNGVDENSVCYSFISESSYQHRLPLVNSMYTVRESDTLFRQSRKIHAKFHGNVSLGDFLRTRIKSYGKESGEQFRTFKATFVVRADGVIDSVVIRNGIGKKFDEQFVKALHESQEYWKPALRNGNPVSVLHTQTFKFNPDFLTHYLLVYREAVEFMNEGRMANAIMNFGTCLETDPDDEGSLINRGICYYMIGEYEKACADWKVVRDNDLSTADALLEKYCN